MSHADRGFTLVEVLIAIVLAAVVVLEVASLFALSVATARDARDATMETTLASQKLEQLWSAASGSAQLVPSPADALTHDVPGYAERVDSLGRDVSAISGGAQGPVYIRRWSVGAAAPYADGSVALHVLVTTAPRDRANVGLADRRGNTREVVLVAVRPWWRD